MNDVVTEEQRNLQTRALQSRTLKRIRFRRSAGIEHRAGDIVGQLVFDDLRQLPEFLLERHSREQLLDACIDGETEEQYGEHGAQRLQRLECGGAPPLYSSQLAAGRRGTPRQ